MSTSKKKPRKVKEEEENDVGPPKPMPASEEARPFPPAAAAAAVAVRLRPAIMGPFSNVLFVNRAQTKFVRVGYSAYPPYNAVIALSRCGDSAVVELSSAEEWHELMVLSPIVNSYYQKPTPERQRHAVAPEISVLLKPIYGVPTAVVETTAGASIALTEWEWSVLERLARELYRHLKNNEVEMRLLVAVFENYALHVALTEEYFFGDMNVSHFTMFSLVATPRAFYEISYHLGARLIQETIDRAKMERQNGTTSILHTRLVSPNDPRSGSKVSSRTFREAVEKMQADIASATS